MRIILMYLGMVVCVFGNGGGYDVGLKFSGGIAPFTAEGTEHVRILEENLTIVLQEKHAEVEVRYVMVNEKDSSVRVTFGFPVEEVKSYWGQELENGGENKAKESVKYCRDYSVEMNGKVFEHEYLQDPVTSGAMKPFPGSEVFKGIEGWMVTQMSLRKGQKVNVVIRYKSDYDFGESSVSDDTQTGSKVFRYRLSTGAVWKGPIGKGVVTIRPERANAKEVKVEKPVNVFKREGQDLVWRFANLEPTMKNDFAVEVSTSYSRFSIYWENKKDGAIAYENKSDRWFLLQQRYSVKASSTLAKDKEHEYEADNLKYWSADGYDENKHAWAEGVEGDGLGESLTFEMTKPVKLSGVYILNGFNRADDLFQANNRVKDYLLLVNGKTELRGRLMDVKEDQFVDLSEVKEPIRSMKFVIVSVYRGTEHRDTCLSGVVLVEPMKEEPKRYGAR